ncbi:hypothetical protein HK096_001897 [Nowakowskiella sp. JEL0078]|nr:hypothetical protein HK096_001897 [Nowakowskiella sp. JEL0078]
MGEHEFLTETWSKIDPSVKKPRIGYSVFVCIVAAIGGLSFGYDLGVLSSVLVMPRFTESLTLSTWDKTNIVGLFLVGCTFGSALQGIFSDKFGRKWTIICGALFVILGGLIQSLALNVPMLFAGRFIDGLAIGAFSALVPVYMAECAIHSFRGAMVTGQQFMIILGMSLAYWVDFLTYRVFPSSDWQWRAPLIVPTLLGLLIFFTMMTMPRSPRWLLSKGHSNEALINLARLRMLPVDNEYVTTEFAEMEWSLERDQQTGSTTFKEMLSTPILRKRLLVICGINAYQQLSGNNGVSYYAPQFYQLLQVGGTDSLLLLQGVYGLIILIMTIPTIFIIERLGRRLILIAGSVIMTFFMLALGILFAVTTGGDPNNVATLVANKSLGILGVCFILLFIAGYMASWGPVVWVVSSEVFPLRVRSKAIAVSSMIQWLSNTLTVYIVPLAMAVNTYGIFIALGLVAFTSIPFVYFFLPETRGATLEEMDDIWLEEKKILNFSRKEMEVQDSLI